MNKELQFLIYNTPQENIKVNVVIKDETIWLTQKAMATLFGVQVPAISKHLKNIFDEGEVDEKVAVSILEITTQHGAIAEKTQNIETRFYNLDAIISVGYRVNSIKATAFRQWAIMAFHHCGFNRHRGFNRHCSLIRHCGLDPQSPITIKQAS